MYFIKRGATLFSCKKLKNLITFGGFTVLKFKPTWWLFAFQPKQ